jgi:hypothetical protein
MDERKPRVPRAPVAAQAIVVELASGGTISGTTLNLSIGGCYGSAITVYGDVVRSEPGKGMAMKFRSLEPGAASMLKRWFFAAGPED